MKYRALVLALAGCVIGCGSGAPHPVPDGGSDSLPVDASADSPTDTPTDSPETGDAAIDMPADVSDGSVTVDASADSPVGGDAPADVPDVSPAAWNEMKPCALMGGDFFTTPSFSSNGTLLALGGTAPRVYSVGPSSLTLVRTFMGLGGLATTAALSPDGSMIAAGADVSLLMSGAYPLAGAAVAVWRVSDGSVVWSRPARPDIYRIALSRDGSLLAISRYSDRSIEIVRAATGESMGSYRGHGRFVTNMVFSPDGTTIASSDGASTLGDVPELHLWRVADRTLIRKLTPWTGSSYGLAFSPDGTQLLGGNGVRWTVADGAATLPPPDPMGGSKAVAFAPDGRTYFTGDLYRASDGAALGRSVRSQNVNAMNGAAYTPDSSQIFVVSDIFGAASIRPFFWRVADGTTGGLLGPDTFDASFGALSPDGTRVMLGSKMYHLPDGARIAAFAAPSDFRGGAFSPDGTTVAVTNTGNGVILVDAATGAVKKSLGTHTGLVRTLAFSPAGDLLASAGDDFQVKLWTVSTGALRLLGDGIDGHTSQVRSVAWSPAGDLLASSGGGIIIWRVADGTIARKITDSVSAPAFFPDGKTLLTTVDLSRVVDGSAITDADARIYDVATGNVVKTVVIPSLARGNALSPGADLAATASDFGTCIWAPSTGEMVIGLPDPIGPTWMAFVANNGVVAVGTSDYGDNHAVYWCRNR